MFSIVCDELKMKYKRHELQMNVLYTGKMKRPAAKPQEKIPEEEKAVVPSVHSGDAAEDVDDGEMDSRQNSRAQRYVFGANVHLLEEKVAKRYNELCSRDQEVSKAQFNWRTNF